MSDDRIRTIINEIEFWKSHKLLPERYCDYLLALYTNGEDKGELEKPQPKKWITFMQIGLTVLLLPFSFLVIYFTRFPSFLQLGFLILFLFYAAITYIYFKNREISSHHLSLIIFLSLLLLTSVYAGNIWIPDTYVIFSIIMLNFVFWFYISSRKHLLYLKISSIIGIVFSIVIIIL
ncbi:hypothetical protein D8M04_01905 [Oceanobacillus piezotolerans]|uniref:Uncharacterized protein n=1 Tax=Oceanobacillus piezotolerans TaxID=2448030 RepID=A0A498DFT9_9BACI|nr:hypothetical protein [Oceanobacillus piezotolerans]RLL48058.1 hypothetical protein D8M04_01905 [Oceanobacillus piezotolerans]